MKELEANGDAFNHTIGDSVGKNETLYDDNAFLVCPGCKDKFTMFEKTPKLLPCLHTMCKDCIKPKTGANSRCALCRKVVRSIENVTDNLLALSIVEQRALRSRNFVAECEECEDKAVSTHRCLDCSRYFCSECKVQHTRSKATKTHTIQSLDEIRSLPLESASMKPTAFCANHSDQRVTMFCTVCNQAICLSCMVLDHQEPHHKCKKIDDAFDEEADKWQDLIAEIDREHQALTTATADTEQTLQSLQSNAEAARAAVKSTMAEALSALREREEQLLRAIETSFQRKTANLTAQLREMESAGLQMHASRRVVGQALRSGRKTSVLRHKDIFFAALADAKAASRALVDPCESDTLRFSPAGLPHVESAINSLGAVAAPPKPPPPAPPAAAAPPPPPPPAAAPPPPPYLSQGFDHSGPGGRLPASAGPSLYASNSAAPPYLSQGFDHQGGRPPAASAPGPAGPNLYASNSGAAPGRGPGAGYGASAAAAAPPPPPQGGYGGGGGLFHDPGQLLQQNIQLLQQPFQMFQQPFQMFQQPLQLLQQPIQLLQQPRIAAAPAPMPPPAAQPFNPWGFLQF